jgi:hypothetical protein
LILFPDRCVRAWRGGPVNSGVSFKKADLLKKTPGRRLEHRTNSAWLFSFSVANAVVMAIQLHGIGNRSSTIKAEP